MRWIDGHLDLAYLAVCGRELRAPLRTGVDGCVSLPALREGGVAVAFGTIFTEPGVTDPAERYGYPASDDIDTAESAGLAQLEVYQELETAGEIALVRSAEDLDRSEPHPLIVLLMEGADPIRGPEDVERWWELGLRMVGLSWAAGTRYAGGNARGGPLTAAGVALVEALDAAGIVHDASHLSDEALDGLLEAARGPVVATHSNCRALLEEKQRHLRDDQIRVIGQRGGIVGLNLYGPFLAAGRRPTIADCAAHVKHICEVMGHCRGVGLGSDMDGGFPASALPDELNHPRKLDALAEALRGEGWTDEEVAGFAHGNWERFLRSALPQPGD